MSKMFASLTTDNLEEAEDRLGGGSDPLPTDLYDATVKIAYAGASPAGAHNVTVILDIDGREVRETVYITNKKGENFYPDKADPSKRNPLPGYTTIDDLCLLTTGEPLTEQATEEKVVKVYDFDQRKEVPTPVPVLGALTGQKIKVGLLREITDKQKKDDSGVYRNTGQTRTQNVIDKFFHAESMRTVVEYRREVMTPEFHDAWKTRNAGKDKDRSSAAKGGTGTTGTGRPGLGGAPATQAPKKKLFG